MGKLGAWSLGGAIAAALALGQAAAQTPPDGTHRVIYYYQTQYYNGQYISLAPMWQKVNPATGKPIVTDMLLSSFHFGYNPDGSPYIHLNDNIPQDPMFDQMWPEVATLQAHGVTARMMLGGAGGAYDVFFGAPSVFYPILKQTLQQYKLDGIDLDVEEAVSLQQIEALISRIRKDFGPNFIITMSPVATDLEYGYGLSGFNYKDLYQSPVGPDIAWFNTQFYSGFGDMSSTADYDRAIANGYPPEKVVAGVLTTPDDGGGYTPLPQTQSTVHALSAEYPTFGGVAGWEYFNSLPGGLSNPIQWAVVMGKAMK